MAKVRSNVTRMYIGASSGAYDLTLGGQQINWAGTRGSIEVTDLADTDVRILPDVNATEMDYSGLWETNTIGNEVGLRSLINLTTPKPITLHLGTAAGDKAVMTRVHLGGYITSTPLKSALPLSGSFETDRESEYGRVLIPKTTISASSQSGSAVDGFLDSNSSGTTAGIVWGYWLMSKSSSQTWTVSLQHASSDADATYAEVDADSSVSATRGIRTAVAGTVKRYTRLHMQQFDKVGDSTGSAIVAGFIKRN